jgi:ribosomal protein L15
MVIYKFYKEFTQLTIYDALGKKSKDNPKNVEEKPKNNIIDLEKKLEENELKDIIEHTKKAYRMVKLREELVPNPRQ